MCTFATATTTPESTERILVAVDDSLDAIAAHLTHKLPLPVSAQHFVEAEVRGACDERSDPEDEALQRRVSRLSSLLVTLHTCGFAPPKPLVRETLHGLLAASTASEARSACGGIQSWLHLARDQPHPAVSLDTRAVELLRDVLAPPSDGASSLAVSASMLCAILAQPTRELQLSASCPEALVDTLVKASLDAFAMEGHRTAQQAFTVQVLLAVHKTDARAARLAKAFAKIVQKLPIPTKQLAVAPAPYRRLLVALAEVGSEATPLVHKVVTHALDALPTLDPLPFGATAASRKSAFKHALSFRFFDKSIAPSSGDRRRSWGLLLLHLSSLLRIYIAEGIETSDMYALGKSVDRLRRVYKRATQSQDIGMDGEAFFFMFARVVLRRQPMSSAEVVNIGGESNLDEGASSPHVPSSRNLKSEASCSTSFTPGRSSSGSRLMRKARDQDHRPAQSASGKKHCVIVIDD
ncbi:hypothetical protein AB1Y20_015349 [Prymnesium parvum]|uniref:Sister chromatid cohesion protein n=1 Tax=Prymnesium parvum TaxID=97485 RepID=A0AB34K151_PRYPA